MNQKCVEKYVSEIQKKRSSYPIPGKNRYKDLFWGFILLKGRYFILDNFLY